MNPFTGGDDDDDEGAELEELEDDAEPFEEEDGKRIPCSAIILCSQYVFNSSLFSMMDEVSTKEDVVTLVEGEGKVVLLPSSVKEEEEERGLFCKESKGIFTFFSCDLETRGNGRGACCCSFSEE